MKRFLYLLLCILFALGACAQKKEMVQIKEYLKKGTNLDKAESTAEKLLKDSANQQNIRIWALLGESLYKQYEQGNEKLYLKQKYDTSKFFNLTKKLFSIYEHIDSLANTNEKDKKNFNKYLTKKAEQLNVYRVNLYNGGVFFVYKNNYQTAYQFFDAYIRCADIPLFKHYNYQSTDTLLPRAAYWSVFCGYKDQKPKETLHHAYTALKDTSHYILMLQYLSETYKLENDTTRYIQTLTEGFRKAPTFPYFFPRLFHYYSENEDWDKALSLTEEALKSDPKNSFFKFAKSNVFLYTGRYDDCIAICDSLIATNDTIKRPYLNAGLAYFYKGTELDKKLKKTKSEQQNVIAYYQKAKPYLETYRQRAPKRSDKWAFPLYIVYLNLNMGPEFDEIDGIIKKNQKDNGH